MLQLNKVCKTYGALNAVKNVSFEVHQGETLVLLGTSGCGKTTTLKMINRLIDPSGGSIIYQGQDICQMNAPALRQQIGYVIQDIGLFPHFTIEQNIEIVPSLLGWDKARKRKRTAELISLLDLKKISITNEWWSKATGWHCQSPGG